MDIDVVVFGLWTPVCHGKQCTLNPNIMGDIAVA
jgi:hypothetical protein